MIKQISIYDLDGTVIDSSHRYRTMPCGTRIDLEHWRANDVPEQIAKDSLLPLADQVRAEIADPSVYVIFATARACIEGDANYKFVSQNFAGVNKFVHRLGVEDRRGGAELKIQAIKPLLNLKQFKNAVVHIFEDNASYLAKMAESLNGVPHFVPSCQGH